MGDSILDGIARWVEDSGRALELRVARAARQCGASGVALSFTYDDPVQQTKREGDVLASFSWVGPLNAACSLQLVVECKSGKEKPWVGIYDGRLAKVGSLPDWTYFAHGSFTAITDSLSDLWAETQSFLIHAEASCLVAAHSGDKNPAGDAVRQVLAATEAQRIEYLRTQSTARRGLVLIPAIVTAAPLIACRLGATNEVQLEEVDSIVVRSHDANAQPCRVYILNEKTFGRFAQDLEQCASVANEHARTQR